VANSELGPRLRCTGRAPQWLMDLALYGASVLYVLLPSLNRHLVLPPPQPSMRVWIPRAPTAVCSLQPAI
jgi:hypothetical protein